MTWEMWPHPSFLDWVGIDSKNAKLVDKCIHPVQYETDIVKVQRLEKLLKKVAKTGGDTTAIQEEMSKVERTGANAIERNLYHWSGFHECVVIYRKNQPKKIKSKELVLTVKMRTGYIGIGDPNMNNGYLGSSGIVEYLDPSSPEHRFLDRYAFML